MRPRWTSPSRTAHSLHLLSRGDALLRTRRFFRVRLPLLPRSPDRHAIELDCGHAYADRHALTGFAAGANSLVQSEVVSNHRDVLQCFRAVTDQGCALYWLRYDAVFNQVSFAGREDELAVGDVDRSAAEVDGVEAAFDGFDDVFGHVIAIE